MWVKVEGLCRILLACSFGEGESTEGSTALGGNRSHGVKKKKKSEA